MQAWKPTLRRVGLRWLVAVGIGPTTALAQQSDTVPRRDTVERSAGALDFISNIAIIGDVLVDLSPDSSTLESARRFELREVHVQLGVRIDERFRGDFIVGLDDGGSVDVMEANLSTTSLPWGLEARAGRFQLPFGKQNATHRPHLPTIDYPYVIQRFLGPHGGRGTGAWVGTSFDALGLRHTLQLTMVEQFPEGHEASDEHDQLGHVTFEPRPASPPNSTLEGLGYTARLRTSWPVSSSASVELSLTGGTGRHTQPFACETAGHYEPCPAGGGETGVNARQSLVGADVTVRLGSLLMQSEYMRQHNAVPALPPGAPPQATYLGPTENPAGAYLFAQWQLSRRMFVGGRFDWVEEVAAGSENFSAVAAQVRFSPNDFSKLLLAVERVRPGTSESFNRLLIQVAVGAGTARQHEH